MVSCVTRRCEFMLSEKLILIILAESLLNYWDEEKLRLFFLYSPIKIPLQKIRSCFTISVVQFVNHGCWTQHWMQMQLFYSICSNHARFSFTIFSETFPTPNLSVLTSIAKCILRFLLLSRMKPLTQKLPTPWKQLIWNTLSKFTMTLLAGLV
jgi:hypothetical protein